VLCIIIELWIFYFEIGNALSKLYKRHILDENSAQAAFAIYKTMPVTLVSVNMKNAIGIFCKYGIYAYDAYYLDIAVRLKMPFLTFDAKMKSVAQDLGVIVLEA
jgi:predicted nucleic acid-binding protein